MPEVDCSKHTLRVRVSLDKSKLETGRRTGLIAALLRQIADYIDGFCVTRDADDADLEPPRSMVFRFSSDSKRTEFDKRIRLYLKGDINAALTRTNG